MSTYKGLTPARNAANKRYDAKTYQKYTFHLRMKEDADIIASIKASQEDGKNKREWMRELFDRAK